MQSLNDTSIDVIDSVRPQAVRVLICDDHSILVQGLSAILEAESDIEVVAVAGSVADAVDYAQRHRPDVVLMDHELPDGDGVEATRLLKQARPEIKVLMLTSYTNEGVLVAALEAGCSGYIIKHDGSTVLIDGVRRAASGEAIVSAAMLGRLLPKLHRTKRNVQADLTPRELEILGFFADGATTTKIAEQLYLSSNTVRNHAQSILTKLGVHSRLEAVSVAVREGLIRR